MKKKTRPRKPKYTEALAEAVREFIWRELFAALESKGITAEVLETSGDKFSMVFKFNLVKLPES